jgi:hypothetical protein
MKISECLVDGRPDMAVSLWLQDKAGNMELNDLPREVVAAHRADRLLVEVNSGGFVGFFAWEREGARDTVDALQELGLADTSKALKAAMLMFSPGGWPQTQEEFEDAQAALMEDEERSNLIDQLDGAVIAQSKLIEDRTHAYIRAHIAAFERLDT